MNRLVLRMLTKALLIAGALDQTATPVPKAGAAPFGTMAEGRWFDSRRDVFNDIGSVPQPAGVVRTDTDERNAMGRGSYPSDDWTARRVELRLEFGLWVKDDDGPGYPAADPRLEARLDLFEFQMEAALRGSHPWVVLWREMFGHEGWRSDPLWFQSEEQGRVKLAAREVVIPVRVNPDCFPVPRRYDDPPQVAALPEALANIIARLRAGSTGDLLAYVNGIEAVLLAESLPLGSVYPKLSSIFWTMPEAHAPAGQEPLAQLKAELLDPEA